MKRIVFGIVALGFAVTAFAYPVLGILVESHPAISVGGHSGWSCTYAVNGQQVTVFESSICTPTKYFE